MSLADALAMATCARNVVLVGDPQQLAQVLQGTHPDGAGASVLEHLLGGSATIPPDRGLFLERPDRLHPDVCALHLGGVLRGPARARSRCAAADDAARDGSALPSGRAQRQPARVGGRGRSRRERDRTALATGVPAGEIMVVAAYNAQVDLLRERLPDDVASAPSTSSRARRPTSSSTRWPPRAARTCRAASTSCSRETGSTSRSRAHSASPTSSARRNCSRSTAAPSSTCGSPTRSAASSRIATE